MKTKLTVRTITLVLPLIAALAVAGCASGNRAPDPRQEWIPLAEFSERVGKGRTSWPSPVVEVPAGAEITLRLGTKPASLLREEPSAWPLEPTDGEHAIRLTVRRTIYLDLEGMQVSTDRVKWESLGTHIFPVLRETSLTMKVAPDQPQVALPVWSVFDVAVIRDPFSSTLK